MKAMRYIIALLMIALMASSAAATGGAVPGGEANIKVSQSFEGKDTGFDCGWWDQPSMIQASTSASNIQTPTGFNGVQGSASLVVDGDDLQSKYKQDLSSTQNKGEFQSSELTDEAILFVRSAEGTQSIDQQVACADYSQTTAGQLLIVDATGDVGAKMLITQGGTAKDTSNFQGSNTGIVDTKYGGIDFEAGYEVTSDPKYVNVYGSNYGNLQSKWGNVDADLWTNYWVGATNGIGTEGYNTVIAKGRDVTIDEENNVFARVFGNEQTDFVQTIEENNANAWAKDDLSVDTLDKSKTVTGAKANNYQFANTNVLGFADDDIHNQNVEDLEHDVA